MAKILLHKKEKKIVDGKERTVSKFKKYYVEKVDQDFHCNEGVIKKADLKKKKAKTNKEIEFSIFPAQFCDAHYRITRGPQIIPLKDVGTIIAITGINKTSKVVDAGAGSGSLAIALANIAKEVHTYEIKDSHLEIVKENIKKLNIKNCKLKKHDLTQGIPQKNLDLVTLDLPEPWLVVKHAVKTIKPGGWLVSYSPTIPQVIDFCTEVEKHEEFYTMKTIELIEREWEIDKRKVRPKTQQLGHSGFLTFVRKIN